MPFEEKLRLLEAVWAELSLEPDRIEVPPWHKDILDERDQAFKLGGIRLSSGRKPRSRSSAPFDED